MRIIIIKINNKEKYNIKKYLLLNKRFLKKLNIKYLLSNRKRKIDFKILIQKNILKIINKKTNNNIE